MKCPSCSSENLPVRETSTVIGSKICLPSHCGQCGRALTEKCPVCEYHHAIGTRFCQANGRNLEAWVSEESSWRMLVQTMEATLTVRPAKTLFFCVLAAIPGLFLMGGLWIGEFARMRAGYFETEEYVINGAFALFTTLLATVLPMAIPVAVAGSIEKGRRRKLFEAQGYRSLEPLDRIVKP